MNCNPTITSEDFKKIHNALCSLRNMQERLDGVVHYKLSKDFSQYVKEISDALKSAYEQDQKSYKTKYDHFTRVQKDLGLSSIWSMFAVDDLNEPHPFEGVTEVVYADHWGQKPVSVRINGLTWAAIYVASDVAIRDSYDYHHIFIESFIQDGSKLILRTGS